LKRVNKSIKILLFNSLGEALKSANAEKKIPSLPKAKELNEIVEEEKRPIYSIGMEEPYNPFNKYRNSAFSFPGETLPFRINPDGTYSLFPDTIINIPQK